MTKYFHANLSEEKPIDARHLHDRKGNSKTMNSTSPYQRGGGSITNATNVQDIDVENIVGNNNKQQETMSTKPKLIHPSLHKIPQDLRYAIAGALNTGILMMSLMMATSSFKHLHSPSKIYTMTNLLCIPIGHAVSSLLVFGWPAKYIKNLCMNAPIGLLGTLLGSICTEFFDRIGFDASCYRVFYGAIESEIAGNMFSSVTVMIITGAWTYVLSNLVNGSSTKDKKGKKEL